MPKRNPIKVGSRFSDLMVLGELSERNYAGAIQYLCQCNCGGIVSVAGSNLRAGKQKSCGCRRHLPHHALPAGVAGFNALYQAYKYQAQLRGYKWELTKKEFKELTKQNCFYCGTKPAQKKKSRQDSRSEPYTYNGVDRVDNKKGYVVNNCTPCCKLCNKMKQGLTQKEFFSHIKKIYNNFL